MELGEIISDALTYPLNNIKALVIYVILGIILGIAVGGTAIGVATGVALKNPFTAIGSGIIGLIIALIIGFVISGYQLDIVKFGINRDAGSPGIDIVRQFINGVKLFVVQIVYYIIPIIIGAILALIFQHWLSGLITIILCIVFALAAFMAQCRLAKTEDLGNALAIGEAIGDISRVGIVKVLLFIILIFVIAFILALIVGFIYQWNGTVGGILMGILGVYLTFFVGRATGLLYSDV
ncbi:MAG: DUF4013 domain-containing protein [Methanobrevibacter sp.]|uniref:DUF4013 domain-containing protein n=1 Tax=Methanobrevibacter sp. TaxID=66852 RepID=UPI0025EC1BDF|nr:DUF4013 domain-containing protein [Methanobrevibacter sp.]MBQ8016939.1 DUF4013 domain-containing protein [Methanobrevibacter sp.]